MHLTICLIDLLVRTYLLASYILEITLYIAGLKKRFCLAVYRGRVTAGIHLGDGGGWLPPSLGAHSPSLAIPGIVRQFSIMHFCFTDCTRCDLRDTKNPNFPGGRCPPDPPYLTACGTASPSLIPQNQNFAIP